MCLATCYFVNSHYIIVFPSVMAQDTSLFLALTDYVDTDSLTRLSADTLHDLVCGEDGQYLDQISRKADCDSVEFVAQPQPGFLITGSTESSIARARSLVEEIMEAISVKSSATSAPRRRRRKKQQTHSYSPMYHPLFSTTTPYFDAASQFSSPPVFVLATPGYCFSGSPGLLPLPGFSEEFFMLEETLLDTPPVRGLSPEECQNIIRSPYLSIARRKKSHPIPSASDTQQTSASSPSNSSPKPIPAFDKEIAEYLPGVPGVRQSKDYKRVRRKISEIDDLVASGVQLDGCQTRKVANRILYIEQIKRLLQGLPLEEDPVVVEPEPIQEPSVQEPRDISVPIPEAPVNIPLQSPTSVVTEEEDEGEDEEGKDYYYEEEEETDSDNIIMESSTTVSESSPVTPMEPVVVSAPPMASSITDLLSSKLHLVLLGFAAGAIIINTDYIFYE
jgi:hypothetical protein